MLQPSPISFRIISIKKIQVKNSLNSSSTYSYKSLWSYEYAAKVAVFPKIRRKMKKLKDTEVTKS